MNTNTSKPSKRILFILLAVLVFGIPLTIYTLQQQQIFLPHAWFTQQTASSTCSDNSGAVINVSFTNTEEDKDMDVTVKDIQTSKSIDLGTVKSKEEKKAQIVTEATVLDKGSVLFTLTWTDKTKGTDTRTAAYNAVKDCKPPVPPFCPNNPDKNVGKCTWDPLDGAAGYEVTVKETATGNTIKSESLPSSASESAFPMDPDKGYQCNVTPINSCGKGSETTSPEKKCPLPTPTPPLCPVGTSKQGACTWDVLEGASSYNVTVKNAKTGDTIKSDTVKAPTNRLEFSADTTTTYQCVVTAVNKCSESPPTESPPVSCNVPTPTPTDKPSPSVTPTPSVTPLPSPSTKPSPTPTITPSPTPSPSPTPTLTPSPTPTPQPTATPRPTPTPVVIVRIPPNVIPPNNQPPVIVQQPPVVVQQPPAVVQQPPVVVQATQVPGAPVTPYPTVRPTGSGTNAIMLVAASAILLFAGTLVFFIL